MVQDKTPLSDGHYQPLMGDKRLTYHSQQRHQPFLSMPLGSHLHRCKTGHTSKLKISWPHLITSRKTHALCTPDGEEGNN